MNGDHQLYGFERLEALVAGLEQNVTPQTLIQAVLTNVMAFAGPVEQHDDITLVAIKINRPD
jgi:serine phosphatase RsbU (regulator of sigma subunit)